MKYSNIKDNLGTIVGLISAVCGFIIILGTSGINIPKAVLIVCGAIPTFSVSVVGVLQGKNPNGTTKTPTQVNELNQAAANTQPIKPV